MAATAVATAPTREPQECVLLVEDDQEAMLFVRYVLHEYGHGKYRLIWANSLSKGLSQLAKERVDIVVLDLGLPESFGRASYACVREVSPKLPVVVLTSDISFETEFLVLEGGAEDYLIKDQISGPLLLQSIRTALLRRKLEQQRPDLQTMTRKQRFSAFRASASLL